MPVSGSWKVTFVPFLLEGDTERKKNIKKPIVKEMNYQVVYMFMSRAS